MYSRIQGIVCYSFLSYTGDAFIHFSFMLKGLSGYLKMYLDTGA